MMSCRQSTPQEKPHQVNEIETIPSADSAAPKNPNKLFPLDMSVYQYRLENNDEYNAVTDGPDGRFGYLIGMARHGVDEFLLYYEEDANLQCEFEPTGVTIFTASGRSQPEDLGSYPSGLLKNAEEDPGSLPMQHPLRAIAKMLSIVRVLTATELSDPLALRLLGVYATKKKKELRLIMPNSVSVKARLIKLFVQQGDPYHCVFLDAVTPRMVSSDELNELFAGNPPTCMVITDQHFGSGHYSMTIDCKDSALFSVNDIDDKTKEEMIQQFDSLWNSLGEEGGIRNAMPAACDWQPDLEKDYEEIRRTGIIL